MRGAVNCITIAVARIVINETKDSLSRCLAHIGTSFADNLVKGFEHCIFDSDIRSFRTRDKL